VQLTFSFDPNCPWTWLTSRWLVTAAAADGHDITWRPLSLARVNEGDDASGEPGEILIGSRRALRMIEVLAEKGDQDAIGRLYEAYGIRHFTRGEPATPGTVRAAAADAGLSGDLVAAMNDASLDEQVTEKTDETVEAAGGDVGSPVLTFGRIGDGPSFFGPIVDEVPDEDTCVRILRAVRELAGVPQFVEFKRGRTRDPQL
jgi:2-hydroxychromene-2-carboxylate isomerase